MVKNVVKKYPQLGSSVNPEKLALTIKGVLLAVITIVVSIGGIFGVTLDVGELTTIVDSIQNAIVAISAAISAVMVVYGGIRKIILRFKK